MASALADALADVNEERYRCPFGQWIDDLADTDAEYHALVMQAIDAIAENRRLHGKSAQGATVPWLTKQLADDGYSWSQHTICAGGSSTRCGRGATASPPG